MSRIIYGTLEDRVNPQFIGIATFYNQAKRQRQHFQKQQQRLISNANFLNNENQKLNRAIQLKRKQLKTAEQVRKRHQNDRIKKIQRQKFRSTQIRQLNRKSQAYRIEHKQKLKSAYQSVLSCRKKAYKTMSEKFESLQSEIYIRRQEQRQEKDYKFHSIEYQKSEGASRINTFFLQKNKESLQDYQNRITSEKNKAKQYQINIERLKREVNRSQQNVYLKKNQIINLSKKIYGIKNKKNNQLLNFTQKLQTPHQFRQKPKNIILSINTLQ